MKKIILFLSLFLVIAITGFWSCSKKEQEPVQEVKAIIPPNPSPQGACDCGSKPTGCNDFVNCVKKLIGNGNSKSFTCNWESCVNPDPGNTYCNGFGVSSEVSTVTICYLPGSCSHVTFRIDNPPSCLPCLPDPYCIPLAVNCNGESYTFSNTEVDPFTNASITVTISGDPKISISCGDGAGNFYNCVGEI